MHKNKPLVSVVVTTKNEERNIANCLKSIKQQDYPGDEIEIIVVDNSSSDRTKEIAGKYTNKVFNKGPERSAQRNFGVEKSKGEYIIYLDADMIPSERVIAECVGAVRRDKDLVALYISEIIMGERFWSKVRRFERSFYDGTVIDCVRFIRKDKFVEAGGFDLSMTGPEDWDLDKKLRDIGRVGLVKEPIYHNEAEFNFKSYLSKKSYYINSFDNYVEKWGKDDPDVKRQLGFYYRFVGVFVENGKWKKIICHPVLVLGMYCLRFLVGTNFLLRKK